MATQFGNSSLRNRITPWLTGFDGPLAFAGLYGKQRTETAARDGQTVLSLYFLIPRGLIGPFKDVFRRVVETAGARALLSGPWPPYNFVTPDFPPDVGTGSGCESVQGEQR